MGYPKTDNTTLMGRLAVTPGRGVDAGKTGSGTADVNVPEMPPPPPGLSVLDQRAWIENWARWRENLAAQFPIPTAPSQLPPTP
jgi:hypothetical protein